MVDVQWAFLWSDIHIKFLCETDVFIAPLSILSIQNHARLVRAREFARELNEHTFDRLMLPGLKGCTPGGKKLQRCGQIGEALAFHKREHDRESSLGG